MNQPPAKPKSLLERLRSLPLKAWVLILVAESVIALILIAVLVVIVFGK